MFLRVTFVSGYSWFNRTCFQFSRIPPASLTHDSFKADTLPLLDNIFPTSPFIHWLPHFHIDWIIIWTCVFVTHATSYTRMPLKVKNLKHMMIRRLRVKKELIIDPYFRFIIFVQCPGTPIRVPPLRQSNSRKNDTIWSLPERTRLNFKRMFIVSDIGPQEKIRDVARFFDWQHASHPNDTHSVSADGSTEINELIMTCKSHSFQKKDAKITQRNNTHKLRWNLHPFCLQRLIIEMLLFFPGRDVRNATHASWNASYDTLSQSVVFQLKSTTESQKVKSLSWHLYVFFPTSTQKIVVDLKIRHNDWSDLWSESWINCMIMTKFHFRRAWSNVRTNHISSRKTDLGTSQKYVGFVLWNLFECQHHLIFLFVAKLYRIIDIATRDWRFLTSRGERDCDTWRKSG